MNDIESCRVRAHSGRSGVSAGLRLTTALAILVSVVGCSREPAAFGNPPPAAQAERFPVVALSGGAEAHIVARARVAEDAARPVQQFVSAFHMPSATLQSAQALAGATLDNFIASGRPDADPTLVADSSGQALALWWGSDGGTQNLYANVFDSGLWSARQVVAADITPGTKRLAVDGASNAVVAWTMAVDARVHTRRFFRSTGWSAPREVPLGVHGRRQLIDLAAQNGVAWVAWQGNDQQMRASRAGGDADWAAPLELGMPTPDAAAALAWHRLAPRGPVLAWAQAGGIASARLDAAGAEVLDAAPLAGLGFVNTIRLAMDGQGRLMLLARVGNSWHWARHDGSAWSAPQRMADWAGELRLAVSAAGHAVVTWPSANRVLAQRYTAGVGWNAVQQVADNLMTAATPAVAMDDASVAVVAWEAASLGNPSPGGSVLRAAVISTPQARFTATPSPARVGQSVRFDGSASSDAEGPITRWQWFVDDQLKPGSGPLLDFTFAAAGSYSIRLVVHDDDGYTNELTQTLVVSNDNTLLTLQVAGDGGTVRSTPAGIDCATDNVGACTLALPVGTVVTLTPTPAADRRFVGWEGDADCSDGQLTLLAATLCIARFELAPSASGWQAVGAPLQHNPAATSRLGRNLMRDPSGRLYALVREDEAIALQRFDSGIWHTVPTATSTAGQALGAGTPDAAMSATGLVCAAWPTQFSTGQKLLRVNCLRSDWASTQGEDPTEPHGSPVLPRDPAIRIDPLDRALVAWEDDGAIFVSRREGPGQYVAMGTPQGTGASRPRLAVGSVGDGQPVLAWVENREPRAARWNGSNWERLGNTAGGIVDDDLVVDVALQADGTPLVASGGKANNTVFVRRYSGSMWQTVGTFNSGSANIRIWHLALDTANATAEPVLAWAENGPMLVLARRFRAGTWQPIGSPVLTTSVIPEWVGVVADDNQPLVIHTTRTTPRTVAVKRFVP